MTHFNIQAKKSLGQNFLKSEEILNEIVSAAVLSEKDIVLEVGPGTGNLTKKLLEKAGSVIAVEKDRRLISVLQNKFFKQISEGKLKLIHDDILNFEFENYQLSTINYKLIANLPFYITGKFLRKFLEPQNQPALSVLMLQKEVAERIVAKDKKESILSISVKLFGNPRYIATVEKSFFKPQPKVDSAILLINNISNKNLEGQNQEHFFKILKAGFSNKRKKLMNNLKKFKVESDWQKIFEECGIDKNSRAEKLDLDKWLCLTKN